MKVILVGSSGALGTELLASAKEYMVPVLQISSSVEDTDSSLKCDLQDVGQIANCLKNLPVFTNDDAAIINSGVIGDIGLAAEVGYEKFATALNINAFSNVELFKELYSKGVRNFIVISSGAALKNYSGWFVYCQSKSIQKGIWESICKDYKDISVRFIAPGVLSSSMHNFTRDIEKGTYPDLSKFYDIKENNDYQQTGESARKIFALLSSESFFKPGSEFLDLRNLAT
jgi:NAD(P)-dependent dehydrogenase (short-subunit alcohol dehydrogenase family)